MARDQANDHARRPHSEGGTAKIIKISVEKRIHQEKVDQMTMQVPYTVDVKKHRSITMKVQ